jgi:hypothetical protein
MEKKRSNFTGSIGFVLAAAGTSGDSRIWQQKVEAECLFCAMWYWHLPLGLRC